MGLFDPIREFLFDNASRERVIVVGLGNPGPEYADTRHNVGWMVLDHLRGVYTFPPFERSREAQSEVSHGYIADRDVLLVAPQTYMNRSGSPVARLVDSRTDAEHLIVVHDDIDLPVGSVRVSRGRGPGGHRGVASIVDTLKTNAFTRVRIGIAPVDEHGTAVKPRGRERVARFVLSPFVPREAELLRSAIDLAVRAIEMVVRDGTIAAMNDINSSVEHKPKGRTT